MNPARRLVLSVLVSVLGLFANADASADRPTVPVLIYHEIVTDGRPPGETVISLDGFSEQMQYLVSQGYVTLSIAELVDLMRGRRTVPPRAVVLTFDDGWKNVLNAVPVLDRYQMKASFWIITGAGIGNDNLEWSDIERLARNPRFEVQSHTVSHPWDGADNLVTWMEGKVPGKGPQDVRAELVDSKRELERRLGRPVNYLAWPVGWFNEAMVELAKESGYQGVLTAEDGSNGPGDDVFHIKRVFVDGACDMAAFERILVKPAYVPCQTTGTVTRGHTPPRR